MPSKQTTLAKWSNAMEQFSIKKATSFASFTRDPKKYSDSGAKLMFQTLKDFLNIYHDDITDYVDADAFCLSEDNLSAYEIVCLVDRSEIKEHTMIPSMRKKYRKAGRTRRLKLDDKFHYVNPLNRIHAYVIVEKSPGKSGDDTMAINVICSSNYSDIKGVGNYVMSSSVECAKKCKFKNIVLEVGNEGLPEHPDYVSDSDDEIETDSEDEETDSEDEEEEENLEELIEEVSCRLWKKTVRHEEGVPYYSIGEHYIQAIVNEYLYNTPPSCDEVDILDDEEYGYGGYYYQKGRNETKHLLTYYESFGFKEDPKVHKEWQCFSELPFPSMILNL
jgi:hypothetical protein